MGGEGGTDKKLNLGMSSPPSRYDDGNEVEGMMLGPEYVAKIFSFKNSCRNFFDQRSF